MKAVIQYFDHFGMQKAIYAEIEFPERPKIEFEEIEVAIPNGTGWVAGSHRWLPLPFKTDEKTLELLIEHWYCSIDTDSFVIEGVCVHSDKKHLHFRNATIKESFVENVSLTEFGIPGRVD